MWGAFSPAALSNIFRWKLEVTKRQPEERPPHASASPQLQTRRTPPSPGTVLFPPGFSLLQDKSEAKKSEIYYTCEEEMQTGWD